MRKMFWKRVIDDVENHGCSDAEVQRLLDFFESTMYSMAASGAYKGYYRLADFSLVSTAGLSSFILKMEKFPDPDGVLWTPETDGELWNGSYKAPGKRLKVAGHLEVC